MADPRLLNGSSGSLPPGGTSGQVLKKTSNTDHDVEWGAAAAGSDAFPVGSVFIAVVSTNPGTLLGYGTWAAFAAGRVLVGLDSGQTEFDTVRETGGAKVHTLVESELPSHTHTITDPGHTHVENQNSATTGGLTGWGARDTSTNTSSATGYSTASATTDITINAAGGGAAHNNLQPYITVYMWERTA